MSVFADRIDRKATHPKPQATENCEPKNCGELSMNDSIEEVSDLGDLDAQIEDRAITMADIEEIAHIRLQHSHYRAIRRVRCAFAEGVLTLRGAVPTFHYKQLAQTAVVDIAGVRQVLNRIEVG
jgi:osmotically-inducible protein OsmY